MSWLPTTAAIEVICQFIHYYLPSNKYITQFNRSLFPEPEPKSYPVTVAPNILLTHHPRLNSTHTQHLQVPSSTAKFITACIGSIITSTSDCNSFISLTPGHCDLLSPDQCLRLRLSSLGCKTEDDLYSKGGCMSQSSITHPLPFYM